MYLNSLRKSVVFNIHNLCKSNIKRYQSKQANSNYLLSNTHNYSAASRKKFHHFTVAKRFLSCWNCGHTFSDQPHFFCPQCSVVQDVDSKFNYFHILSLDEKFDVKAKQLQKAFTNLQRQLHPDKFMLKSSKEQEISSDVSSLINKAYFTLLKPLSRAIYMLKLRGIEFGEEIRADDPMLLMELMELNERVDDSSLSDKKVLMKELEEKLQDITLEISHLFQENQTEKVKETVIRLKYYTNISERVREQLPPE